MRMLLILAPVLLAAAMPAALGVDDRYDAVWGLERIWHYDWVEGSEEMSVSTAGSYARGDIVKIDIGIPTPGYHLPYVTTEVWSPDRSEIVFKSSVAKYPHRAHTQVVFQTDGPEWAEGNYLVKTYFGKMEDDDPRSECNPRPPSMCSYEPEYQFCDPKPRPDWCLDTPHMSMRAKAETSFDLVAPKAEDQDVPASRPRTPDAPPPNSLILSSPDPALKKRSPGFPSLDTSPDQYARMYEDDPDFRKWFDKEFAGRDVLQVTGYPVTKIEGFPSTDTPPSHYIGRYENEPDYREWFDGSFSGYTVQGFLGFPGPLPAWLKGEGIAGAAEYLAAEGRVRAGAGEPRPAPGWAEDVADLWASGAISDAEFVSVVQFMLDRGIIGLSGGAPECFCLAVDWTSDPPIVRVGTDGITPSECENAGGYCFDPADRLPNPGGLWTPIVDEGELNRVVDAMLHATGHTITGKECESGMHKYTTAEGWIQFAGSCDPFRPHTWYVTYFLHDAITKDDEAMLAILDDLMDFLGFEYNDTVLNAGYDHMFHMPAIEYRWSDGTEDRYYPLHGGVGYQDKFYDDDPEMRIIVGEWVGDPLVYEPHLENKAKTWLQITDFLEGDEDLQNSVCNPTFSQEIRNGVVGPMYIVRPYGFPFFVAYDVGNCEDKFPEVRSDRHQITVVIDAVSGEHVWHDVDQRVFDRYARAEEFWLEHIVPFRP